MDWEKEISFSSEKNKTVKLEKEYEYVANALKNLEENYSLSRQEPSNFESDQPGYSAHDILLDQEQLEGKRKKYNELSSEKKISKLKADFLERLIIVGASKYEWFGKSAQAFLSSEYDDEINHIDGLVTFNPPEHVTTFRTLGFDFDATFTTDIDNIFVKVHALKNDLDNYRLPRVKYMRDSVSERNGVELPKVVLGCDNQSLDQLIEKISKGDFDEIEKSTARDKILLQAESQLRAFKERYGKRSAYYLRQKNLITDKESEQYKELDLEHRKFSRVFDMHSQILGFIQLSMREQGIRAPEDFMSDAVHEKIIYAASQINKSK